MQKRACFVPFLHHFDMLETIVLYLPSVPQRAFCLLFVRAHGGGWQMLLGHFLLLAFFPAKLSACQRANFKLSFTSFLFLVGWLKLIYIMSGASMNLT